MFYQSLQKTAAALTLLLLLVFSTISAFAQGIVTGSASGVVQDQQGAVISGANVNATQLSLIHI